MTNEKFLSFVVPCANDGRVAKTLVNLKRLGIHDFTSIEMIVCGQAEESWLPNYARLISVAPPKKGKCVRQGVLSTTGSAVIICDADLPVALSEISAFIKNLDSYDAVIGNRRDIYSSVAPKPSFDRKVLSYGFGLIVQIMFGLHGVDTQFGVKALRGTVARDVFRRTYLESAAYDVEVVLELLRQGRRIKWVPVTVKNPPSKTAAAWEMAPGMFRDLLCLWRSRRYNMRGMLRQS